MCGDLNEIMDNLKKFGGRQSWKRKSFLKQFMQDVAGIDLGFMGGLFTWDNLQGGQASIRERLDIAVADRRWLESNPHATVEHLNFEASDHCPILIQSDGEIKNRMQPFRFFKTWTSDKSSSYVVEKAWNANWGIEWYKLKRSLTETTKALRIWNRTIFGFANKQIQDLEAELRSI